MSKEEFPSEKNLEKENSESKTKKAPIKGEEHKKEDQKQDQKLAEEVANLKEKIKILKINTCVVKQKFKICKIAMQKNVLNSSNMNLKA